MDLDISPKDQQFREEVRTWLEENKPRDPLPLGGKEMREYMMSWQRKQYEGGWAGVSWPKEYGGLGLTPIQELIWYEEYAAADAPPLGMNTIGQLHGGLTVMAMGSEEQKSVHLPPILKGDVVWCQGFSEPGAGSDLANLQCKAEIDGDHLVVNGQKVWTSYGHLADYQCLLVRTDNTGNKYQGITWVIGDMSLPGIDIRPIHTMDGRSEFCEVFYTDVRIPLANVVGEVNDGWAVTMATLGFERGTTFFNECILAERKLQRLIELAKNTPSANGTGTAFEDDAIALQLGRLSAQMEALHKMILLGVSRSLRSPVPGPEGAMVKLMRAELEFKTRNLAMDIRGTDGLVMDEGEGWTRDYLHSFALKIGGGTSEIMRNIIGERVLGLPKHK